MRWFWTCVWVLALANPASAWLVDKQPDLGGTWRPFGTAQGAIPIWADSFVFEGGADNRVSMMGVYLRKVADEAPTFRLQLLADAGNAPSGTVLLQSGFMLTNSNTLERISAGFGGSVTLTQGRRYWVAVNAVGGGGGGAYELGGHTQNSGGIVDDGTLWYSSAGDLSNWDGQRLTPEMAIVVGTVPEPASLMALGLGLLALRRRK